MFLTECPRDAMQGWGTFIPTDQKIDYINSLMTVGFDVLDCGSFVSLKAIPQMADSGQVIDQIDRSGSSTKLSVIVANIRGAEKALAHNNVDILGFPFSISETFQFRNTNKDQQEAFRQIKEIKSMADKEGRKLNIYFSMAFGNPYGEQWKIENVEQWVESFLEIGVSELQLADTTGVATPELIGQVFDVLITKYPQVTFGAHFHNRYEDSYLKIDAAYLKGCRSFDTAIKGIGGCPMAKDDLVGNLPTEQLINYMQLKGVTHSLNLLHFESAYNKAKDIFHF